MIYSDPEPSLAQYWEDDARDEEYRRHFVPADIDVPVRRLGCHWIPARGSFEEYYHSEKFLLELSNASKNDFSTAQREAYGIFARFSLGGRSGASWYWVSLQPKGERWQVVRVVPLDISDG